MSNYYEINSPHVISESLSGETVIINLQTGTYHNLNDNGSQIWQALGEPINIDILLNCIKFTSSIPDRSELQKTLEHFFEDLLKQGLVRVSLQSKRIDSCNVINLSGLDLVCESYADMQDLLGLDPIHDADPQAGWPHKQNNPSS